MESSATFLAFWRATSRGMLVYYHNSAASYVVRNNFGMIIAATKQGCN